MLITTVDTRFDYDVLAPAHFRLHLQAMRDEVQTLHAESLHVSQAQLGQPQAAEPALQLHQDEIGNRFVRFDAEPGPLQVRYHVEATRADEAARDDLREHAVNELPDALIPALMSSRYCEVELLANDAGRLFGQVAPGVARVEAIVDWVRRHIDYRVGSSRSSTTAATAYQQRAGVCRDFAHLCITFCRALNLPARLVVGYVLFDEPPQDFHAIFEVWLGRWVAFDPTGLAPPGRVIRVGVGADAKDVAFATIFGAAKMRAMVIDIADTDTATGQTRHGDNSVRVI